MSDHNAPVAAGNSAHRGKLSLHTKILLGMSIGAVIGISANFALRVSASAPNAEALDTNANGLNDSLDWLAGSVADPLGRVFLRLIMMVVLPLVFSALVLGVTGIGDIAKLGKLGLRTLLFTLLLSGTSVAIGIGLVNLIQPGARLTAEQRAQLQANYAKDAVDKIENAKKSKPLQQVLLDLLPENPLQEMVGAVDGSSKGNGMLAVMIFALIFGIAMTGIQPPSRAALQTLFEGLFEIAMKIIEFAMWLAPFGIACLMFSITARLGVEVLWLLMAFMATVLLGLSLQMFGVFSLALAVFAGRRPITFFSQAQEAIFTAFGTSSSNATLPTALRVAQENVGLPPEIARFVLTVGSTANQNGTALYEGVVVLFLAQVFGVELSLVQQLTVVLLSVLAGVGTAGVPGGSIPQIVVVLQTVGVPPDGIAIILGLDRLLDMCRTTLNVTGDLVLASCVAGRGSVAAGPLNSASIIAEQSA